MNNNYFVDFAKLNGISKFDGTDAPYWRDCYMFTEMGLWRYGNEIVYDVLRIIDNNPNPLNAKAAIKQHFGLPQ